MLDAVMDYWTVLSWDEEASPSRRADAAARQRKVYAHTLGDRPWERAVAGSAAEPEEMVAELIDKLRALHTPVIVDTAGFRTTISALVAADLAIIPLKSAAEDLDCAIATYDLIREINETPERQGHPIRTAMILTMTMRGTVSARHVRSQLKAAAVVILPRMASARVGSPIRSCQRSTAIWLVIRVAPRP
jgi:cellulose biosynthesis protein BcsQ